MKKVQQGSLALLGLLLFTASSCKKVTTENPSVTSNASLSSATVYKDHYDIDLSEGWVEINSCTNEILDITKGIWHVTVHTTTTADGRLILKFHNNTSNYKLVNLTTGVEYVGSYVSNDQLTINLADPIYNAPFEETYTLSVLLTTPGGGNNSTLKVTYHITVDANGNLTSAWFENFRYGCQ